MSLITIILFFLYAWGLGHSIVGTLVRIENQYERNLMRIGLGLALFIIIGTLFNLLGIPLHWWIFLLLSLISPTICFSLDLIKKSKDKSFENTKNTFKLDLKLSKSNLYIWIVIIIFIVMLFMYASGSFKYPYLENDDPWEYAVSAKYVSHAKQLDQPGNFKIKFLDPYPPGYSLFMGVLHQTSPSLMWTLKFFNALFIALGIIFFYFFAKEFTGNKKKALFSTFILAVLPCYFTHFIWSISLVIPLFFVAMYFLERIKNNIKNNSENNGNDNSKNKEDDAKNLYPAGISIAGILLTHPSMSVKIVVLFVLYFIVKLFYDRKNSVKIASAGIIGLIISLLWWLQNGIDMLLRGARVGGGKNALGEGEALNLVTYIERTFPADSGTATMPYSFGDFVFAKPFGGINIHFGFGVMVSILLLLAVFFVIWKHKQILKKENSWMTVSVLWFLAMYLNVNSLTFNLPIGFFSFRSWLLLAVPTALLSAVGLWFIIAIIKGLKSYKKEFIFIVVAIVIISTIMTSFVPKFKHNTLASWPPGASWTSMEEIQGYLWLKELPVDTKVFLYSRDDSFALGLDKFSCSWCNDVIEFRSKILDYNLSELHSFLVTNQYQYLVVSGMSYKYLGKLYGENRTTESINALLNSMQNSSKFSIAHQTQGALVLKVN